MNPMPETTPVVHDSSESVFAFDMRDDLAAPGAPVGHAEGVVTILLDEAALTGIALSPAAARALGATLIELSVMAEHRIEAPAPERVRIALD
jgi:hypothetical protein